MYYFSGLRSVYHGYVSGIISLQVIRDGTPQLVSTGPLRAGTAVHFICTSIVLFSSMETLFVGRFVTTG